MMIAGSFSGWSQRLLPWLGVALLIVAADQFSKMVIEKAFHLGDVRPVTGKWSTFVSTRRSAR